MLTLLFTANLGTAGNAGGASVGTPVVSVGVTNPPTGGGGGGMRHFGAVYEYNDPAILAVKEEIKILKEEKKELKKEDNTGAMLEAINQRLRELYALLEKRKVLYQRTVENYEYKARMAAEQEAERVRVKKEKRQRRMRTILRLLDS